MIEQQHLTLPPLVTLGHPRLAQPARPVEMAVVGTAAFHGRLTVLQQAMVAYAGIGIAAPQIGWFERFFIMLAGDVDSAGEPEHALRAWINPEIVAASDEHNWAWEGCLSVPGLRGWIRRPAAVAVQGYDAHGHQVSREYAGWNARVFQHEFDHLDGMLFPYRAQDPRHIVTLQELAARATWPPDWPARGARDAPLGEVLAE